MDTFLFYDGMKIYNHIIDVDELWILQDKTGLKIDIDDMIWSNKEDRYILKSDADFDNVHGWITKKRG